MIIEYESIIDTYNDTLAWLNMMLRSRSANSGDGANPYEVLKLFIIFPLVVGHGKYSYLKIQLMEVLKYMNEKLTLTIKEAAKSLGICEDIVRGLAKREDFPAIRFKRKIIVNKLGLEKWLSDNNGKILY